MSVLIICEKPSVAKTVALALGAAEQKDGYLSGDGLLVSWCIGHLISMADAGSYDERYKKWRYEDLPILPQTWKYAPTPGKEKQLAILKELLHRSDVSEVVNGCDAGREGELIFRFVYEQAGCTKPFSRLWISSMEDSSIREGFAGRRAGTEYDALYQSALCRARADWLVGINATRLFSVLYHKTLNVGRVLSPTLNLLVERDGKITMFHKEKYHIVHIGCGGVDAESERISDAAAADALRTACEASQAVCVSLKKEKKTALPPKLFDLTSLQREANRVYGFTAKQTLDYAQSLYEKRFLTYPRTDSNYLTEDMAQTATDLAAALLPVLPFVQGAELMPEIGRVINSAKVSDHHAIIPTAAFAGNGFDGLPESEKKLMSLVCCKLLCAVAAPQEYETVTAVFDCGGKPFTAKGKTILMAGWKDIDARFRAAARRAGDEHHAVSAGGREIDHHRRNMQRVRVRQAEGHDAAGRRQRAALLVGVAAEARLPVEGEGKIVVAVAAEHLVAVPARHAVGLLNHAGRVLGQELAFGQRHQMPLDLGRRGRTGNQKQIRSADFQHFLQDFRQFHGHSSPAASNSRSSPSGSPSSVTRRYTALT